ncbi:MAG: HD domain-containing protein [Ruminococcaceae bacterium]|nr:HD domain-containing protein [Oscillospiraceae bacterium]
MPPTDIEAIRRLAADARVSPELMQYMETNVFPQYFQNDKGHQLDHVFYVIRRSLLFMEQFDRLDADMVYTIAAYHDIAHHVNKDEHEVLSAEALRSDAGIRQFFTEEQLRIMAEAIKDHRASLAHQPRSDYGRVVSSADRSTDIDAFFRRTHAYSLKHYPGHTEEEHMERCYQHMQSKYGSGGYAKSYVADNEYARFLEAIQRLLANKEAFMEKYRAITGRQQ